MSKLFTETYEDTAEGRASQPLAGVATAVEQYLGARMPDEMRLGCIIDVHRIERDDLPEETHSLFNELRAYFGVE